MREYIITTSSGIRSYIEARHMPEAFSLFLAENESAIERADRERHNSMTVTIFTVGGKHAGNSD